jgi:hypothetical protein
MPIEMFYFEHDQPHYLVWPALALGIDNEFWISISWLNLEIGWRNGNGGNTEHTKGKAT